MSIGDTYKTCVVCGRTDADCTRCGDLVGCKGFWDGQFSEPVCTQCTTAYIIVGHSKDRVLLLIDVAKLPVLEKAKRFADQRGYITRARMINREIKRRLAG